jgi:small subunit ribosomal protein S9
LANLTKWFYGTGRRKTSVARVWLHPGEGKVIINDLPMADYLTRSVLEKVLLQPVEAVKGFGQFDVVARVNGGGKSGQAGAVRHGIARALLAYDISTRSILKKGGFLTRDAREKERKKYGRKRARKRFQYSKR